MRSVPPLLRFSGVAGLSVLVFSLSVGPWADAAGEAHADGGAAASSPDDMLLDLGGATLETRRVPHGSFTQGAPASEVGHEKDEEPAHHVTITKDFWIGKYPVTRGQFAKFVADTRYVSDAEKGQSGGAGWAGAVVPDGGKNGPVLVQKKEFTWRNPGFTQTDEHPVVLVSYGDANAFVGWASRKSGKRVRLPTEAEWELAARGGTTTAWSGGAAAESDPASYGWFKPNAGNGTRPVGQKKANPLGLFDMSGDVMEWCRDVYAPYREGALVDPEVTTNTGNEPERRVLRGGSWFRDPKRGRSAARYKNTPGSRNADNGFRVVVTNEETVTPGVTGPGPDFVPAGPLGGPAPSGASSSSGPLANGEPLRTDAAGPPGDAFSWGLLLASPVAAASAVVAWMLLRRKKKPGSTPEAPAKQTNAFGVSTRAAADGFFVNVPDVSPGARIRYECFVNGTQVSDVVPLDGGKETFVYTGSPPTAIRILEIIAGARGYRTADRPAAPAEVPLTPPSDPGQRRPSQAPPLPAAAARNVTNVTNVVTHVHRDSPRPLLVPFVETVVVAPDSSPSPVPPPALIEAVTASEEMAAAETVTTGAMRSSAAIAAVAAAEETDKDDTSSPAPEKVPSSPPPPSPSSSPSPSPDAPPPDEAFLGNPRAY
jgi:formylglycine-generating enzyme required for sulfatase activity